MGSCAGKSSSPDRPSRESDLHITTTDLETTPFYEKRFSMTNTPSNCPGIDRASYTEGVGRLCRIPADWSRTGGFASNIWMHLYRVLSTKSMRCMLRLDIPMQFHKPPAKPNTFLEFILNQLQVMPSHYEQIMKYNQVTHPYACVQLMEGVIENLKASGYDWHKPVHTDPTAENGASLLHVIMSLRYEAEPIKTLLPTMVELVKVLLAQPTYCQMPIDSCRGRVEGDTPLQTIFQWSSQCGAKLLPMIMLLRQHGAQVNSRVWAHLKHSRYHDIELLLHWTTAELEFRYTQSPHEIVEIESAESLNYPPNETFLEEVRKQLRAEPHNTGLSLFVEIIEQLVQQSKDAELARVNSPSSSIEDRSKDHTRFDAEIRFRTWQQKRLQSLPMTLLSVRLLDALRPPFTDTSHYAASDLLDAIQNHPEYVHLDEMDAEGNPLLSRIFALPPIHFRRLSSYSVWFLDKVSALDSYVFRSGGLHSPFLLDYLLQQHHPREEGDFIWKLYDIVLQKTFKPTDLDASRNDSPELSPTAASATTLLFDTASSSSSSTTSSSSSSIGINDVALSLPGPDSTSTTAFFHRHLAHLHSWWSVLALGGKHCVGYPLVMMSMNETRLILDLLLKYGLQMLTSPYAEEDFFLILLRSNNLERIRSWLELTARTSDVIWPTRWGAQWNYSLLDSIKYLLLKRSQSSHRPSTTQAYMFEMFKFIDEEWSATHWPMIRADLTSNLTAELADLIIDFVKPTPQFQPPLSPQSPTNTQDLITSAQSQ